MAGEGSQVKPPIRLFYSYSHKDEDLRLKLQDHLAGLKWSGMIAEWHDRKIEAGKEWEKEIDHHLSSADVILLLVSASFIASEYCWSVEVKKALERHERGEARVIPVILRPCRWQRTPFAKLQATPKDAKPVTKWPDRDAAFDDVVSKIAAVVDELRRRANTTAVPATGGAEPEAGDQIGREVLCQKENVLKIFISYSHDGPEHEERVLDLANRLCEDGIDAEIDQYHLAPPEGWPMWCERQIAMADFVLMVCTETYHRRVKGGEAPGQGLGAIYEARIIRQLIYDSGAVSTKFIPVLFSNGSADHIPLPAKGWTWYVVDTEDGYDGLYRQLTNQPTIIRPQLGKRKALPPKQSKAEAKAAIRFPDFAVFRDVGTEWCPEMVALPASAFLMGSPKNEEGRRDAEGPQHRVTIAYRFAIGRYSVTFDEYDHFCAETGRKKPKDRGWDRGRRPVINVSWHDAQAYVTWLAEATGKPYRLPSEAEWEYAARAGTTTRYAFGDEITEKEANFGGNVGKTTEVGAYPANAWGLYDMHGNVWEWVEDIRHDSYEEAPADGSAWTGGARKQSSYDRVNRGGSWNSIPWKCRSAHRNGNHPDYRSIYLGFRVARTLD